MVAPALYLILAVVLVVNLWPEIRTCLLSLERLARRAEALLSNLWACVLVVGVVMVALPFELVDRWRRRND